MKALIFLLLVTASTAQASKVIDVCILKAGKSNVNAAVTISCTSRAEPIERNHSGKADTWAMYKAIEIKALLNQGYEMKSDDTFVKYQK